MKTSDCNRATRSSFLRFFTKAVIAGVTAFSMSGGASAFQWKGMEITPSITTETEYTDNLFYDEHNQEEDVINRVSPGIAIRIPGQYRELEFSYAAGFEFFVENPDQDTVTHTARARARIQPVERLNIIVEDTFFRGTDVGEIDIYGLRRRREDYWHNTVTSNMEYTFGTNRVLNLGYVNRKLAYDRSDLEDSREDTGTAHLRYQISQRNIAIVGYTYTHGDFESEFGELDGHIVELGYEYLFNPQTTIFVNGSFLLRNYTGPTEVDYRVYNSLLGIRRELAPHLSISAAGGYFYYDPDEGDESDGFSGNCTATYELERTKFNFVAHIGYEEILFAVEDLGLAFGWGVTGSISHMLHRFWRVEASGSYNFRDYEDSPREDRFWTARTALSFEPVDWFNARIRYEHSELNARAASDYKVNRVILTLRFSY